MLMIVKSDGRRNSLPFFIVYLHVTFTTYHMAHEICLKDGWPIHLANKYIVFGLVDDCLTSETLLFQSPDEECLLCWLSARYNSDSLIFYDIQYFGKYCDVFIRLQYIDSKDSANNILDELHFTCIVR